MTAPEILATMRAVNLDVINEAYKLSESTRARPSATPSRAMSSFALASASYRHTNGRVASGSLNSMLAIIASHEGAGTVGAIWSKATDLFKLGDRFMCGVNFRACGRCCHCRAGNDIKVKIKVFHELDKLDELMMHMVEGVKMQGKTVIVVDWEKIKKEKTSGAIG
jgi:hypothetical protein